MRIRRTYCLLVVALVLLTGVDSARSAITVTFQQGVNSYYGTQDTEVQGGQFANMSFGDSYQAVIAVPPCEDQALLRFDGIVGLGPNQILPSSCIVDAMLRLCVADDGYGYTEGTTVHEMLVPWNENVTWNSMNNGISTDNVEARMAAVGRLTGPFAIGQYKTLNVNESVQAWSSGNDNHGWAFIIEDNGKQSGWSFHTSESSAALRPQLTVTYAVPYTPINTTPTTELPNTACNKRAKATTPEIPDRFVVFDGQGGWEPSGPLDRSKPTIVMSHGYNSSYEDWPKQTADAMTLKGVDANIVAWNWEDDAKPYGPVPFVDMDIAGCNAVNHGKFLGNALLEKLGKDYDQPIHLIGHSFGTRVNKVAADLLHKEGFASEKTHVTILDAAESSFAIPQYAIGWSNPIPDETVGYIDNYITFSGQLHAKAVNVQLFEDQSNLNTVEFHSLPTEWYCETIGNNIANPVGHYRSFEAEGIDDAKDPGTHYRQLNEPSDGEPHQKLSVASQSLLEATARQRSRDRWNYPGLVRWGGDLGIQGVRVAGTVTAGIRDEVVEDLLCQSLSLDFVSFSPAYAWATIDTPNDAEYVTFDLLFEGLDEDDFFAFGVDDTLMLSLDQSHIEDGVLTNVGLLSVSQWAGSSVDFFFGLETAEAGRHVSVENFVFMSAVPEPSALVLLATGALALLVVARCRRR